jgi:hypothetical protein
MSPLASSIMSADHNHQQQLRNEGVRDRERKMRNSIRFEMSD